MRYISEPMGYELTLENYYRVRKTGEYPWPCKDDENRTILLHEDSVLTKHADGTFTKRGPYFTNIILKPHQIRRVKERVTLLIQ